MSRRDAAGSALNPATKSSDVLIIGAGVIGCAIAHELARRGASVEVIDHRPVAMGATQASAGILAPFIEAREGNPLLDIAVRSLELYDDFVSRAVTDGGTAVPYRRTGTLDVAFDDPEMRAVRETAGVLEQRGIAAQLLDAAGVQREEPNVANDVVGGLLIPAHGFVAAAELTRALAAAARRNGAQLVAPNRVRRISAHEGELVVHTDKGLLTSGCVVLAAGSWSGDIAVDGAAAAPVRPVRGQLLALSWRGSPLKRVTWSSGCYLVPWDDGTLLVGATAEDAGFDERTTVAGVRDLLDAACDVIPQVWTAGFVGARVGLRPATPDSLPIVGFSTVLDGLMYATGHFRNGVLLAPLTATLVADALLANGRDAIPASLSPARFGAL